MRRSKPIHGSLRLHAAMHQPPVMGRSVPSRLCTVLGQAPAARQLQTIMRLKAVGRQSLMLCMPCSADEAATCRPAVPACSPAQCSAHKSSTGATGPAFTLDGMRLCLLTAERLLNLPAFRARAKLLGIELPEQALPVNPLRRVPAAVSSKERLGEGPAWRQLLDFVLCQCRAAQHVLHRLAMLCAAVPLFGLVIP